MLFLCWHLDEFLAPNRSFESFLLWRIEMYVKCAKVGVMQKVLSGEIFGSKNSKGLTLNHRLWVRIVLAVSIDSGCYINVKHRINLVPKKNPTYKQYSLIVRCINHCCGYHKRARSNPFSFKCICGIYFGLGILKNDFDLRKLTTLSNLWNNFNYFLMIW